MSTIENKKDVPTKALANIHKTMQRKKRIGVVGLGGVGGYYGAMLAMHNEIAQEYELIFIMRGEGKQKVIEQGLHITTVNGSFTVHPTLVSDTPEIIGSLDLIIFCTKTYDLENAAIQYKPCVHEGTIVLPLLNGVENSEILQRIYPESKVLQGCAYIVSKIESPGCIVERGNSDQLFFGNKDIEPEKLDWIVDIFRKARINFVYSKEIKRIIWEKFAFVCSVGTLTSYLDKPTGLILETDEYRNCLRSMIMEIMLLAEAKGIRFNDNFLEEALLKMSKLPYHTTSSLHHDLKNGHRTELESLPGYVVLSAREKQIQVPMFDSLYVNLKLNTNSHLYGSEL